MHGIIASERSGMEARVHVIFYTVGNFVDEYLESHRTLWYGDIRTNIDRSSD